MKILVLVLLLLTGCTQAQPELRETKEVQTSIPYSDEELIKNANDQIEDEAYYVDSITQQSDTEVWFSLKNKDLNKSQLKSIQRRIRIELYENISFGFTFINGLYTSTTRT